MSVWSLRLDMSQTSLQCRWDGFSSGDVEQTNRYVWRRCIDVSKSFRSRQEIREIGRSQVI